MAFLGGLSLLGAVNEAETDLKSKQAIAQAHVANAQKQNESLALGQLMSLFQQPGAPGMPSPDFGGGTPMPAGAPPEAQPQAGPSPSPAPQAPPSAPPQVAAQPPASQGPVPAQPAQAPGLSPGDPLAQAGPQLQRVGQARQQQTAAPEAPPGPNGQPSFGNRFNASFTPDQPQGMTPGVSSGTPVQPDPNTTFAPKGKRLMNVASEAEQRQFGMQPQGQQTAQADPVTQQLQARARAGDQGAAATLRDPQKVQALQRAYPKYQQIMQKMQQWQSSQDRMRAGQAATERRFEATQQRLREFHEDALKKQAQDEADRQERLGIAKEKQATEKQEVETLAGGLKKTGGEYRTSIKDIPKSILAKVQARAIELGLNFRQAEEEQRRQDAYDAAVGRVGATLSQRVEFSARELSQAIPQVRETSAALPRGEFLPYNQLKQYFGKAVGDPALNDHIIALQTARNAYGRAMNPMGVPRVTENAQLRFDNIMTSALGPKALEVQLERLWKEAQQMQRAAAAMVPGSKEFGQPIGSPDEIPTDPSSPLSITIHPGGAAEGGGPPASALQEGVNTTFKGGRGTWTLKDGKPVRVDQ